MSAGFGLPALSGVLLATEAGLPVPVPADLVMLAAGERAAAGDVPLWGAVLALEIAAVAGTCLLFVLARGPARALVHRVGRHVGLTEARMGRAAELIDQRGRSAMVVGRATPGLRTVTVVAAAATGAHPRRALPALVLGSTIFFQAHLVLGYLAGDAARALFDRARGPLLVTVAVVAVVGLAVLVARRGRRGGVGAWTEACCPACLAVNLLDRPTPALATVR